MTVAAPPPPTAPLAPPPGGPDPEALIEEARQRARRRRWRRGGALAAAIALIAGSAVLAAHNPLGGGSTTAPADASARTPIPQGNLIAYAAGNGLYLIAPNGTGRRKIATCRPTQPGDDCVIAQFAWSPNGRSLAFVSGTPHLNKPSHMSVHLIDADGRHETRLASCAGTLVTKIDPSDCGWGWRAVVSWSPDSTRLVFSRGGALAVMTVADHRVRRITSCAIQDCIDLAPAWSPRGDRIAFTRGDGLFTVRPDGSGLRRLARVQASNPDWSPDGRLLAFDTLHGVSVIRMDGSGLRKLAGSAQPGVGPGVPSWSPDGSHIAYFQTPGHRGAYRSEVWIMNADGGGRRLLYRGRCCVGLWAPPVWSPDGQQLAFADLGGQPLLPDGGAFTVRIADGHLQRLTGTLDTPELLAWQPRLFS